MTFKLADRIAETSTAPGTGAMILNGPKQGAAAFSSFMSNGDTTWAAADNGTSWQTGLATYASANNSITFTVDANFRSSNANAAVNFSSGTVSVFVDFGAVRFGALANIIASGTAIAPPTSGAAALGTAALPFSDLFLKSGGVINLANGDVLITHSTNLLAFTGASSGYTFDAAVTFGTATFTGLTEDTAPDGAADFLMSYDASATAFKKMLLHRATAIKVGSFTRDTATATGTQAITGVGFKPKAIVLFAGVGSSAKMSWGLDDGTTHLDHYDASGLGAGTYNPQASGVFLLTDGSNFYSGNISTFDADGFTMTWTKTGSPTGTATISYMAFR